MNLETSHDPGFGGLIRDPGALQVWCDRHLAGGPIQLTQIRGGASNALFKVEQGGQVYALRRPPLVSNDPTSNNMLRELRLLRALAQTDVVHSRLIAGCEDAEVIGAPFSVMEWIDGFMPIKPLPEPYVSDAAVRRRMGEELIDALAGIHKVDWKGIGLEGFGKPDGFLERQVSRWLTQLQRYRTRELPHLDSVVAWLQKNTPATARAGLMHGDYFVANVMMSRSEPGRLLAVIDWESATIGDPLLDLGHLLSAWEDETSGPTWGDSADWRDFPTRRAAAERYAAATGLPIDQLHYYMVLAMFRLACILEGAYARYASGKSNDPNHKMMETLVPQMFTQAAQLAGVAG